MEDNIVRTERLLMRRAEVRDLVVAPSPGMV